MLNEKRIIVIGAGEVGTTFSILMCELANRGFINNVAGEFYFAG
jgi:NAD/NADP transhydrogenase beta subunit